MIGPSNDWSGSSHTNLGNRASHSFLRSLAIGIVAATAWSTPVLAHTSNLGGVRETPSVPSWLVLLTGGAVIGASFLLVSMVTDRQFIGSVHRWGRVVEFTGPDWIGRVGGALGVLALLALVAVGLYGPATSTANFTVLAVWALWWAGYTMTVYLLGNTWPLFNPWRALADVVPWTFDWSYPSWLGSWPSLVGLFALVWVEVTNPIAERPAHLAGVIVAYSLITVAGAVAVGSKQWFEHVDPVSRVFRFYGWIAPIQRIDGDVRVGVPGWYLAEGERLGGMDDVAFVVGLLWLTTFDGLVATPAWRAVIAPLVTVGVPAPVAYFGLLVGGFAAFWFAYLLAARYGTTFANTLLDDHLVAVRFAQALLPIAAGYHLAHYLGYFLQFLPSTVVLAGSPLSPPAQLPVLVLPAWFGTLQLGFVLAGHVLAIWVAHSIAFETFTGRLQPIRSQYPFTLAMIVFTTVSIGIVSQPSISLPYL